MNITREDAIAIVTSLPLAESEILGEYIADLERQRDTAHRAAITAALQIFREQYQAAMTDTGGDREAATYCGLQAVEKMTPADVVKQREGTL